MTPAMPMYGSIFDCSKCEREIPWDETPALDSRTNLPVCSRCTRVQRHVRRKATA